MADVRATPDDGLLAARIRAVLAARPADAAARKQTIQGFKHTINESISMVVVFRILRRAFDGAETNEVGSIDVHHLSEVMSELGTVCESAEVEDVFMSVAGNQSQRITFDSFVAHIMIASLAGFLPVIHPAVTERDGAAAAAGGAEAASTPAEPQPIDQETAAYLLGLPVEVRYGSVTQGDGLSIALCALLLLDAYLHLDVHGTGHISIDQLRRSFHQEEEAPGTALHRSEVLRFLTPDKWEGLRWDGTRHVDFHSFVGTFMHWIGVHDAEYDSDAVVAVECEEPGRQSWCSIS